MVKHVNYESQNRIWWSFFFFFLSAIYQKNTCTSKSELDFTVTAQQHGNKEHPCSFSHSNWMTRAYIRTSVIYFLPSLKVVHSVQATKSEKQLSSVENQQKESLATLSFLEIILSGGTSHQELWLNLYTFKSVRVFKHSLKKC